MFSSVSKQIQQAQTMAKTCTLSMLLLISCILGVHSTNPSIDPTTASTAYGPTISTTISGVSTSQFETSANDPYCKISYKVTAKQIGSNVRKIYSYKVYDAPNAPPCCQYKAPPPITLTIPAGKNHDDYIKGWIKDQCKNKCNC